MTKADLFRFWTALTLCCAPVFSQLITYQVSFSGVTSGPVLVRPLGFQYVSDGFLQPNANGLVRLIGQPGFSMNGAPPAGYILSDVVFFPNAGAPYFSLGFVNGPTSILLDFRPQPVSPLLAAGTYPLVIGTNLLVAGAQPLAGNAGTGTLLITTPTAPRPVLSVNPPAIALTYRPGYPPPDSIALAVTTDSVSVDFTAAVSDPTWMLCKHHINPSGHSAERGA